MLQMDEINKIKKLHVNQGKSFYAISKQKGRSWSTVRKYCNSTIEELKKRGKRSRSTTKVTETVLAEINRFLDDEIIKNVPKKQRYSSTYIFKRLVAGGIYGGSERQIRKYIRRLRSEKHQGKTSKEARLDLGFSPGYYLQLDHGEATVNIGNKEIIGYLFVASVPGLVLRYAQFYFNKDGLCWANFHEKAFKFFGGRFENCIYDNDTALVVPATQEWTQVFHDIVSHYDFKVILCNKASGWEKGSVENGVGYCRRNFLAGVPEFESIGEMNCYLDGKSREDIQNETHYETGRPLHEGLPILQAQLRPIKDDHEWTVITDGLVGTQQTVKYKGFQYSVPEKHIGSTLKMAISIEKIKIFDQNDDLIYDHPRHYLEKIDSLIIDHFYEQLARKPRAWDYAKVVQNHKFSEVLTEINVRLHYIGERLSVHPTTEFVNILKLQRSTTVDIFETAIKMALSYGGVSCSAINSIIRQLEFGATVSPMPLHELPMDCRINIEKEFNIEKYNALI